MDALRTLWNRAFNCCFRNRVFHLGTLRLPARKVILSCSLLPPGAGDESVANQLLPSFCLLQLASDSLVLWVSTAKYSLESSSGGLG
jgi:hypothetical protein